LPIELKGQRIACDLFIEETNIDIAKRIYNPFGVKNVLAYESHLLQVVMTFDEEIYLEYVCGNGTIETWDQCDDGNQIDGDGCSAVCTSEQVVEGGKIMGCIYYDANSNGIIDNGEMTLPDWEIILFACSLEPLPTGEMFYYPIGMLSNELLQAGQCIIINSVVTNEDGCYAFSDLPPGDYGVSETPNSNWQQTLPMDDSFYYFNLEEGVQKFGIDFANTIVTYCGNEQIDSPNSSGFYEECDGDEGVVPGYFCSAQCLLIEGSGGGAAPVIKAKWEMRAPYSDLAGIDDDVYSAGTQIIALSGGTENVSVCTIATDPDGLDHIDAVYAEIYKQEELKGSYELFPLNKYDSYELFCESVKNNNYNLPWFYNNYDYSLICAEDGELKKETSRVYCSDVEISISASEQEMGTERIVRAYALDKAGLLSDEAINSIAFLPFISGTFCGDGICDSSEEDCDNCPTDCGQCNPEPFCGDGNCDPDEACDVCVADCGTCQVDNTPPIINITSPLNNSTYYSNHITVFGNAYDNVGLVSVQVRVGTNGIWYETNGTGSWSKSVQLNGNSTTIYARAIDTRGLYDQKSITINPDVPAQCQVSISIREGTNKQDQYNYYEQEKDRIVDETLALAAVVAAMPDFDPIGEYFRFNKDLRRDMYDSDVAKMQRVLDVENVYFAGYYDYRFGPQTEAAVVRFQEKYWREILLPWGLGPHDGTGHVGETTRAKLNKILNEHWTETRRISNEADRLIAEANELQTLMDKMKNDLNLSTINVSSNYSGASTYMSGNYVGTTNFTKYDVNPRWYTFKFNKSGYYDCEKQINISPGSTYTINASLIPYEIPPAETCYDNAQNQNETWRDCGGVCSGCPLGRPCVINNDCQSNYCDTGICAEKPVTPEPEEFILSAAAPYCDTVAPAGPAVRLEWATVGEASRYELYRNNSLYVSLPETQLNFVNNILLNAGESYSYQIKALINSELIESNIISVNIPADICDGVTMAQCGDGIDNDGDGQIDLADSMCENSSDDDESGEEVYFKVLSSAHSAGLMLKEPISMEFEKIDKIIPAKYDGDTNAQNYIKRLFPYLFFNIQGIVDYFLEQIGLVDVIPVDVVLKAIPDDNGDIHMENESGESYYHVASYPEGDVSGWIPESQFEKTNVKPIYGIPPEFKSFDTDLTKGSYGYDVYYLQIMLNLFDDSKLYPPIKDICTGDMTTSGATGCESRNFGAITENAVARFQDMTKINRVIAESNNLDPDSFSCLSLLHGCGRVGPLTRAELTKYLKAGMEIREDLEQEELLEDDERKSLVVSIVSNEEYREDHGLDEFPVELILGMINHESPLDLNNEFVAGDWGRGITQVTSNAYVSQEGNCKNRVNSNYECQKIYSNTVNGITSNLDDGINLLSEKYGYASSHTYETISAPKEICGLSNDLVISSKDFLYMSALARYNGIQLQGKAIYKIYTGSTTKEVLDYLKREYGSITLRSTFKNNVWLDYVRQVCEGADTFSDCWRSLSYESNMKPNNSGKLTYLVTSYSYLSKIADNLGVSIATNETQNWINKLKCTDSTSLIAFIASPAELVVTDNSGRSIGTENGMVVNTMPNSWVDIVSNLITMFFPPEDLRYKVKGLMDGQYDLVIAEKNGIGELVIQDITTSQGEVHNYIPDWEAIRNNEEEQVVIEIDKEGDGIIDNTFISTGRLTQEEFILNSETKLECEPDSLHVYGRNDWITCYVELLDGYYPWLIDGSLATLNGVSAYTGKQDWAQSHATDANTFDYDEDGVTERMLKFDVGAVVDTLESGEDRVLELKGEIKNYATGSTTSFSAKDTITINDTSAKELIANAKVRLENLNNNKVKQAVKQIEKALKDKYWEDDNHLKRASGVEVFGYLKTALQKLEQAERQASEEEKIVIEEAHQDIKLATKIIVRLAIEEWKERMEERLQKYPYLRWISRRFEAVLEQIIKKMDIDYNKLPQIWKQTF
jgi:cysteine-rich repeat protein